ncbi:MAG: hypothetical protein ACJAVV_001126 [Alphaproteobacteria bacterium]|jgi:hypothetical protein
MKASTLKALAVALFTSAVLTGCKTTEPLYYHGEYQQMVYSYFKGDETSASEQIVVLETVIETAAANGKAIAPGVNAHLGMLYFETGSPGQGATHFEQEKALFPESAVYLDFLLKSSQGE